MKMGEKLKTGAKIAEIVADSTKNVKVKTVAKTVAKGAKIADSANGLTEILEGVFNEFKLGDMKVAKEFLGNDYMEIKKGVIAAVKIASKEGNEDEAIKDLENMVILLANKLIKGLAAKGLAGPVASPIVYCLAYLSIKYWNTRYTKRLTEQSDGDGLSEWLKEKENKKIMGTRKGRVELRGKLKEKLVSLTVDSLESGNVNIFDPQEKYLSETYPILDGGGEDEDDDEKISNILERLEKLEKRVENLEEEIE